MACMVDNMKQITVANNMIIKGFYMKEKNGEYIHYSWDDEDGVYWADDDEIFYYEIPQNAILTLK